MGITRGELEIFAHLAEAAFGTRAGNTFDPVVFNTESLVPLPGGALLLRGTRDGRLEVWGVPPVK